ncbi:MAG: photosystem II manganese-stabilizing polypeptide [Elainellaceae cyanobacterium]
MRYQTFIALLLSLCIGILTACGQNPTVKSDSLTYDQIKGSGLANLCPRLSETDRDIIPIDPNQSYSVTDMCLQPTTFLVKREPVMKRQEAGFVPGKLLTRASSALDHINGLLNIEPDNSLTFFEQGGIDFQPITVQLPGNKRVPMLFTIKGLVAKSQSGLDSLNPSTRFNGTFKVPSYRTSGFLDPRGRGLSVGYDSAVGLPSQADDEEFLRENVKMFETGQGKIFLDVTHVSRSTGEIAGLFESEQISDTDFGSKEPLDVKIQGLFYARLGTEVASIP